MLLRTSAVLAALALAFATTTDAFAAPSAGPLVPPASSTKSCAVPASLSGAMKLPSDCVYDQPFVLETSNTTLDCNGARISVSGNRGLVVRGDIENVTVKNCYFERSGIRVSPPERKQGETEDAWRLRAPRNVVLSRLSVKDTEASGIFIGPAVVGATLEDSIVENAGSAGVYLEFGTQRTYVRRNVIKKNGFTGKGIQRSGWSLREGIAVDAAAYNVIEENHFEGNAFGGVFLYKNCWEHVSTEDKHGPRPQHAHSNEIRGNTFVDMQIGVWIASRQARDLGSWDCGDPTPYANPIPIAQAFPPGYAPYKSAIPAPYDPNLEYLGAAFEGRPCLGGCLPNRTAIYAWLDYAENNSVIGNRFEKISLAGVRIEDDDAKIKDNRFVGDFEYVYLGTPLRSRFLNKPIKNTEITGNTFEPTDIAKSKFEQHAAILAGEHVGSVITNNVCATCPAAPAVDGGGSVQNPPGPAGTSPPSDEPNGSLNVAAGGSVTEPGASDGCSAAPLRRGADQAWAFGVFALIAARAAASARRCRSARAARR